MPGFLFVFRLAEEEEESLDNRRRTEAGGEKHAVGRTHTYVQQHKRGKLGNGPKIVVHREREKSCNVCSRERLSSPLKLIFAPPGKAPWKVASREEGVRRRNFPRLTF